MKSLWQIPSDSHPRRCTAASHRPPLPPQRHLTVTKPVFVWVMLLPGISAWQSLGEGMVLPITIFICSLCDSFLPKHGSMNHSRKKQPHRPLLLQHFTAEAYLGMIFIYYENEVFHKSLPTNQLFLNLYIKTQRKKRKEIFWVFYVPSVGKGVAQKTWPVAEKLLMKERESLLLVDMAGGSPVDGTTSYTHGQQ